MGVNHILQPKNEEQETVTIWTPSENKSVAEFTYPALQFRIPTTGSSFPSNQL